MNALEIQYQLLCEDHGQAAQNSTLDGRIAIFILEKTDEQPQHRFPIRIVHRARSISSAHG
jgi:hypothetical protein